MESVVWKVIKIIMSVKFSNSIEEALGKTYSIAKAFVLDKTFLVFAAMKTHEDNWNMYAKLIIYFPQEYDEKWISLKFNEIFGQPLFGGLLHKPDLKVVLISGFGHVFYIEKENGFTRQAAWLWAMVLWWRLWVMRSRFMTARLGRIFQKEKNCLGK